MTVIGTYHDHDFMGVKGSMYVLELFIFEKEHFIVLLEVLKILGAVPILPLANQSLLPEVSFAKYTITLCMTRRRAMSMICTSSVV